MLRKKPHEIPTEAELDNTPQITPGAQKLKSGVRFARVLLVFIMAITAIVILFTNVDKINVDNFKRLAAKIDLGVSTTTKPDNAVINYDYDITQTIKTYKDGIARITAEDLSITDNIGTLFQNVLTGFNNPQLVTTKKYVCAYDLGGKRLIVTNSFEVLFDTTFDDNIVNVSINQNGYMSVITESEAYKNHLIVYNPSFKEIYKINSMNRYFVCADISPNNKTVSVSSLYIKGSNVTPQINCYSLSKTEPIWTVDFNENVAVDIKVKPNSNTVALFEWGVCVLNSKGKELYRYQLNSDILQAYTLGDNKYNLVVTSASVSGVSKVTVFNDNGVEVSSTQLNYCVKSTDMLSDRFVLLGTKDISLYTVSGKSLSVIPNPNDAGQILFSDKNSVFAVSASSCAYNSFN